MLHFIFVFLICAKLFDWIDGLNWFMVFIPLFVNVIYCIGYAVGINEMQGKFDKAIDCWIEQCNSEIAEKK
jgi:hypothetical protein